MYTHPYLNQYNTCLGIDHFIVHSSHGDDGMGVDLETLYINISRNQKGLHT
jgi:hypothetical protein